MGWTIRIRSDRFQRLCSRRDGIKIRRSVHYLAVDIRKNRTNPRPLLWQRFCVRQAGFCHPLRLINKQRIFSKEQLTEMYRCAADTPETNVALTYEHSETNQRAHSGGGGARPAEHEIGNATTALTRHVKLNCYLVRAGVLCSNLIWV